MLTPNRRAAIDDKDTDFRRQPSRHEKPTLTESVPLANLKNLFALQENICSMMSTKHPAPPFSSSQRRLRDSGRYRPHLLKAVCSLCITFVPQLGVAQSSAADARRAIEDSTASTKRLSIEKPSKVDNEQRIAIPELAGIDVVGPSPLASSVKTYWSPWMGKAINHETLAEFKSWFSEEVRKAGVLTFVFTEIKEMADGRQTLILTLTSPKIQSVQLLSDATSLTPKYRELLNSRLSEYFILGAGLDIDGLDQYLERISYDLPVNLEATVKPAGPELVDLLVSASSVDSQPGEFKHLAFQVNNHGLKQFGQVQLIGFASIGGLVPNASANFTALASDGIKFLSADHEILTPELSGRMRIFGSYSINRNIKNGEAATKGLSTEVGLGLIRQEMSLRDLIFRSNTEISSRHSANTLLISNTNTGDTKDKQFRLIFSLDNERIRRFPMTANMTLSAGHLSSASIDTTSSGIYYKLGARIKFSRPMTMDGKWYGNFKSQLQLVNRNIDSYNKLSIGGTQGVRAYTSSDGVGDAGAASSIEINHLFDNGLTTGFFYDAGRVKPNKFLRNGAFNETYTLQSVGMSFTGNWINCKYSGHIGKGLGGYKFYESQPNATESKSNPLRVAWTIAFNL